MAGSTGSLRAGAASGAAESARLQGEAQALADRLPDLLMDAKRISSTIAQGIHGRRRAGPGETFWQFRQYQSSDAARLIDWRRSASSDHLYVREREWEAAHTVWLWPDLSASMAYRSHLAPTTKRERAVVLVLALAELLVRGGERVGLLGLTSPMASRNAATRMAEAVATHGSDAAATASLPPPARLQRHAGLVVMSDFLDPLEPLAERLTQLAGDGVTGHLVQVMDPAEETLPFEGRAEFLGSEGGERWIADRVETLRPLYTAKLAAHRAGLQALAHRLGWSLLVHHTDRAAAEPLLALIARLQGGSASPRWGSAPVPAGDQGGAST